MEFVGLKAIEPKQLLPYMELRPSEGLGRRRAHYYVPGLERIDSRRITEVYAARGHFDAKVIEFATRDVSSRRQRRIDLRFTVDEGPATVIVASELNGSLPVEAEVLSALVHGLNGQVFDVERFDATARELERRLQTHGFAYASVEEQAEIDRDLQRAHLRFSVTSGPKVQIAGVQFRGLERVPESELAREFSDLSGRAYTPKLLEEVEARAYGLGVFSAVTAELAEDAGPRAHANLRVVVTERPLQSVEAGIGLSVDPQRWQQRAKFAYSHASAFGELTRLNARVSAGWAEIDPFTPELSHGPLADVELELRKRGFLERRLVWRFSPQFELGVEPGYQYWAVRHHLSVSRFIARWLELSAGYHHRVVGFFADERLQAGLRQSFLGLDHRDPYALGRLSLAATLHLTDSLTQPQEGIRASIAYSFAHPWLGGQFAHHSLRLDLRAYLLPHPRWQLAARAGLGLLFPFGPAAGVPIDLRFHLGGAADVRGWGTRRLSPRVNVACSLAVCPQLPVGGHGMLLANLETRVRTVAKLWLAAFVDAGDVRVQPRDLRLSGLQLSVGGGLRWQSEIGTLRADYGHRILTDRTRFSDPRQWGLHLSLGQAF